MEPNESQQHQQHFSSPYFNQHPNVVNVPSPTNGSHVVYPQSVPSSAVTAPLEPPVKRKRGRPRRYGTPEQALAAKKTASSSSARQRKEHLGSATTSSYSGSSRKSPLSSLGNTGQGFTPHIINVAAGEDVAQKVMFFMQQSKHELCVLSASGTISNASLRQPAASGGNVTYEGRFEILSLSGSYIQTELGGRTGGLSVCISSPDGQVIGGGVGGPLKAAGPVQVIVGTFQIGTNKGISGGGAKGDALGGLPSPVGTASMLGIGFRSAMEPSGRNSVSGNDELQTMGGGHFMIQPSRGMHMATPSRHSIWASDNDGRSTTGYDLTGRVGHQSSENGDYEQIHD